VKRVLSTFLLVSILPAICWALIDNEPDHSLLWNQFSSATVVDSFAVLTADEGIVVCRIDASDGMLEPVSHLLLPTPPQDRRRFDDVLVIRSTVDILYFIDLSQLPDIKLLGDVDLEIEINDFALDGNNLYVCAGFDGLFRYNLTDHNSAQFIDSSMLGVHYVEVEIDNDRMYAVDDYNGVLTYDISGDGFGIFQHILYMPFRVRELIPIDSEIAVLTVASEILLAQWTDTSLSIVDTIACNFRPKALFGADSLILVIAEDGQWYDVINRGDKSHLSGVLSPSVSPDLLGDVLLLNDALQVFLPTVDGGVSMIDIENLPAYTSVVPVYDRPGPIKTVFFHNKTLYSGGVRNPLDAFSTIPDGKPQYVTTYFPGLTNVRAASLQGDSLFVLYPQVEAIFLLEITPYDLEFSTMLEADSNLSRDLRFNSQLVGGFRSLFGMGYTHFDTYVFNEVQDITKLDIMFSLAPILDIAIVDSLLVFSTNKSKLWVYRIFDDFSLEYRSTLSVPSRHSELVSLPADPGRGFECRLIAFGQDGMRLINLADPALPVVEEFVSLPVHVTASCLEDQLLYTIGHDGIGIIDITDYIPRLVDHGGRGGTMIAVDHGLTAVSNGNSIHLYNLQGYSENETIADAANSDISALENYPNPFNPVTTISYHVASSAQVELSIYNLLGQAVVTLVNEFQPAGPQVTSWNGQDGHNQSVASGIYFCRLRVGSDIYSRKMLFVK
jgi:hypothetical protein